MSMRITLLNQQGAREVQPADLTGLIEARTGTLWVDITGPSDDDLHVLSNVFHFHPLAVEDTRNERQRPKAEEYPGYLFMIVNPVTLHPKDKEEIIFRELDIFVGHHYVVTVHADGANALEQARRRCGQEHVSSMMSPGYLLYVLVDTVVDGYFPVLDIIDEHIEELEDDILLKPRQQTLNDLFQLKRMLNEVWRVSSQQRDMFNVLTRRDLIFIDHDHLQYQFRDVYDHLIRITDMASTFRDLLTSMVDLYMSAVSNNLNYVVNRLTIITVAVGALAVITGFYGMNFEQTWPPFSASWGVPFVIFLMLLVFSGVIILLRRQR